MAELIPVPFPTLVRSMFTSLAERGSVFDIPRARFFRTPEGLDLSVHLHGARAATPFGPAAGPHGQMAQNLVMAWLTGSRILELKTVQINDTLAIPRPCIDVPNLGFNVEWSQELRVPQSLAEYVKGAMLIDLLIHSSTLHGGEALALSPGDDATLFDMSVGYDLAGIRGDKVRGFIDGMRDASALVEAFRAQIPEPWAHLRDVPFRTCISDAITLSTFHGCPPGEVEAIGTHLIEELGVHTIIKLNPTLLGPERLRGLLHDHLGYDELVVPDQAFTDDMQWDQAVGILSRLKERADRAGVGFGAKFTNTLIVQNHRGVFPESEQVMYLSGDPLHVLSMTLAAEFRERFGDTMQYSFSAGINAGNFVDTLCAGLTPVTACTDLLKKGGYGRTQKILRGLTKAMKGAGVRTVEALVIARCAEAEDALAEVADPALAARVATLRAEGQGPTEALFAAGGDSALLTAWKGACATRNGSTYRDRLHGGDAYSKARLARPPKKPGTPLWMFDCLTCDICVPVCPNDANFTYDLDVATVPVEKAVKAAEGWIWLEAEGVAANKKHQIANLADLCNECGNCDTFCPDLGGPYLLKPRFFGSLEQWRAWPEHDGFYVEPAREGGRRVWGRFDGRAFSAERHDDGRFTFGFPPDTGAETGAFVLVDPDQRTIDDAAAPLPEGAELDLTYLHLLDTMRRAILRLPGHYLSV